MVLGKLKQNGGVFDLLVLREELHVSYVLNMFSGQLLTDNLAINSLSGVLLFYCSFFVIHCAHCGQRTEAHKSTGIHAFCAPLCGRVQQAVVCCRATGSRLNRPSFADTFSRFTRNFRISTEKYPIQSTFRNGMLVPRNNIRAAGFFK